MFKKVLAGLMILSLVFFIGACSQVSDTTSSVTDMTQGAELRSSLIRGSPNSGSDTTGALTDELAASPQDFAMTANDSEMMAKPPPRTTEEAFVATDNLSHLAFPIGLTETSSSHNTYCANISPTSERKSFVA